MKWLICKSARVSSSSEQRDCVCRCQNQHAGSVHFFHGDFAGEKVRPVSSPTPCSTPPNQLFYFKNSCDPAALVRAGCSLLCYTSEDPKSKLGSFPCHCSRQATGLLGERGSVLMTAKISSMHLELSQHSACPQDKGNYTHLQVSNLAFLVIFFFFPFKGGVLS